MSTPLSPSQAAFQALEFNLKTVLLHTGSALSNASSIDGTALLFTRSQLEKTLPDALRNWHGALNDLEEQLWNAKAALHRDLDTLRRNKSSTGNQTPSQTSPAQSLDSDTVMVDAPVERQSAHASPQQANSSSGGPSKDELILVEDSQKPTSSMQTWTPQDQMTNTNIPSQTSSQDNAQKKAGLLQDPEANLDPSPKAVNFSTDSPMLSIEAASMGSSLGDAANDFANTDVGEMLPGLMHYANTGVSSTGNAGDSAGSMNLDDFSADHVFSNQPAIGQLDASNTGAGDDLDDLFGETDFGAVGNRNTFSQSEPGDFDTSFNFNDLITSDDLNTNSADPGSAFDPSLFGDDFFNFDADVSGNGT